MKTIENKRFSNVWEALEDTEQSAVNMRLRSELMNALSEFIKQNDFSQVEAARLFAVTQPRISDLMRGRIDLFGLDSLVNMAAAARFHVHMQLKQAA